MMSQIERNLNQLGLVNLIHHVSMLRLLAIAAVLLVTRFIANGIYRLYFHPLRNFPGPKLRAFTRIPNHISTWKGDNVREFRILHEKYGHVVRITPYELSFTHPDAWRDVNGHGTKGTQGSLPHKNWTRYGLLPNKTTNLINAREADHGRMRKIFTPAFSDRALKQQEPLFLRYTDKLVSNLRRVALNEPDQKCEMVRLYNFTTFDIMGDLTFGEPLHMLDNAEYDPWVRLIFKSMKFSARLAILSTYETFWSLFKRIKAESINRKRLKHFEYSSVRVAKRLEKGRDAEGVDLWDLVLNQDQGKGLSRNEMDANASLFMVAGTETTATLVSGLTYYLLKNPECMRKVVDEIRSAFATSDEMSLEKLAALPYLAANIKEALRLYPPVPLGLPRLTPEDGSTICGQFVPPNTQIAVQQYAMFTNEQSFQRPLEYIPERWLGNKRFDSDARHAVQPFSVGARDCLGKNMAYHEMRLIIAKVLYSFDLELARESSDWADQKTFFLWQKNPLFCRIKVAGSEARTA